MADCCKSLCCYLKKVKNHGFGLFIVYILYFKQQYIIKLVYLLLVKSDLVYRSRLTIEQNTLAKKCNFGEELPEDSIQHDNLEVPRDLNYTCSVLF